MFSSLLFIELSEAVQLIMRLIASAAILSNLNAV